MNYFSSSQRSSKVATPGMDGVIECCNVVIANYRIITNVDLVFS